MRPRDKRHVRTFVHYKPHMPFSARSQMPMIRISLLIKITNLIILTEDGKPGDNPFWGPLQGKYLSAVYYYCTNKTRIFQKQILMLRFSELWSDFRIMIHSNTFKSNSRKIQTECGLANLYADWWILKQRVDVIKMKIIVYIQNPKSLPHVTWVTPNIRKNIKVKENFMFYF